MAWKIDLDTAAERELDKLDPQTARRILLFLHSRVAVLDDPRRISEALKGSRHGSFWKYRVGDYRIITSIEDSVLHILVVQVGDELRIRPAQRRMGDVLGKLAKFSPDFMAQGRGENMEGERETL